MIQAQKPAFEFLFSLRWLCAGIMVMALAITWMAPKDDNSDAWSYHYYAGAMLLDHRVNLDYFGASTQGYFNPLVHAPFAAMVKAGWPDIFVGAAMALYSALALCLVVVFYRVCIGLQRWALVGALGLTLACLLVWTCVGSSVSDLFLQIPVFLSLICFFKTRDYHHQIFLFFLAGFFLGAALGLKLSAVIFIPPFGVLWLIWVFNRTATFRQFLCYCVGGLVGFILLYAWWGITLYQLFGNPFFPFFNQWFKSPYFASEAAANYRFISTSFFEQALLPFRAASSDAFTYIELREPDIRPGVFVLAVITLLASRFLIKGRWGKSGKTLTSVERDFLIFLMVSLYSWVFLSGNGRYGVAIFALLGGGVLVALRAALPFKIFRTLFLLVFILQMFVISQLWAWETPSFRYRKTAWGGQWFNINFEKVLGKGNQLILTGTRSSYSVLVKDMGSNSSLINVYGVYALDDDPIIEKKITQYEGRILGMVLAGAKQQGNVAWMKKVYFEQFSRFGLALKDYSHCQFVGKKELDGSVGGGFMFCPLVKDSIVAHQYEEKTREAKEYFSRIEQLCPELFTPKKYAVTLVEQTKEKFYANYEIDVSYRSANEVYAKKQWSMMIFPLGTLAETKSLSAAQWHEKYCDPLRRSKAMTKE